MDIKVDENLQEQINQLERILQLLEQVKEKKYLTFVGVKDMCEATGWSEPTVKNLFNRPDFPSCDFGKEKKAEITAVINYFSVPRRK